MTATPPRKRRRTSARTRNRSIPGLEERGLSQLQQRLLVAVASVVGVLAAAVALTFAITTLGNDFVPERAHNVSHQ